MHTLVVPYFKQEQPYSCGPAALRMLLAYRGILVSEEELTQALRTTPVGTCNQRLADVATLFCTAVAFTESSLGAVRAHLRSGTPVLINYVNPEGDIGHFAVVVGYSDTHVSIHDPKNGEGYHLHNDEFVSRWVSGDGMYVRWGVVLSA